MRIRLAIPEGELRENERKAALDAALEAVTRTIEPMVGRGRVPPAAEAIRAGKVRWKPEPPGEENFDIPQTVLSRGYGDCDDLAPWHAASLRASGRDPGARAVVKKSGPSRWHAVVRRSDGSIEDPSKAAGMGSRVSGADDVSPMAPIWRPMAPESLALAIYPVDVPTVSGIVPVTIARVDAPDAALPWSWSTHHIAGEPRDALCGAIRMMRALGQEGAELDDDDDERMAVIDDLVSGASPREIAEAIDEVGGDYLPLVEGVEIVGFLGDVFKKVAAPIARIAAPIVKTALPIAATAFGGPLGTAAGGLVASLIPTPGGGAAAPAPMGFTAPMGFPGFPPQMMQQMMQMMMRQFGGGGMGMPMQSFRGGPQFFRF